LCKAVLEGRGFRPRRFWWSRLSPRYYPAGPAPESIPGRAGRPGRL